MSRYWDGRLKDAILSNNIELAQKTIDQGANVNTPYKSFTPLHRASELGHIEIVQLLIKNDADANISSRSGVTPIYIAATKNHVDTVRLLIENGANVNVRDGKGMTPLHHAAKNGFVRMVYLLIENGATINAKSTSNKTPWGLACKYGHSNALDDAFKNGRERRKSTHSGPDQTNVEPKSLDDLQKTLKYPCRICAANEADHVIMSCGHSYCGYCLDAFKRTSSQCPNCCGPIESTIKIMD